MKHYSSNRQRGVTLIVSLLLLVLLTLLSVSALRSASIQELSVGNSHEYALSFAAAESGVNDAIDQITARYSTNAGQPISSSDCANTSGCTFYYRPSCTKDASVTNSAAQNCEVVSSPSGTNYLWDTTKTGSDYYRALTDWWGTDSNSNTTDSHSIKFGIQSGETSTIAKVSAQPRYVVERFRTVKPLSVGQPTVYYYQITSLGVGRGRASTVVIQTSYVYPEIKD